VLDMAQRQQLTGTDLCNLEGPTGLVWGARDPRGTEVREVEPARADQLGRGADLAKGDTPVGGFRLAA
jgi:hypothetical protein